MIRKYYEKIVAGEEVRVSLIGLREELKEEKNRRAFAYLLGGDFSVLCRLLKDNDPKVRRNAALILGQLESEDVLPVLFAAYEKEETRFVRADYLKAMSGMDYRTYVSQMEARLEELRSREVTIEEQKHVSEEIHMLQSLVMKYRRVRRHKFIGQKVETDVILVTNRCQREVTARQIGKGEVKLLAGGLRVKGARVKDLLAIRTYGEMLFPLVTRPLKADDPEETGRIAAPAVAAMAEEFHEGDGPFLFRVELKSGIAPEKKGTYIRKLSDALEKASNGLLINSVADYELELRLLAKKDGTFAPMLKFYTIPDRRFSYRRESVASSITPVNAALTAQLARPWLKEGAQILDPFCGVGTMLIERHHAVQAGVMYGIDIFGEAIDRARNNTDRDGCHIYYINKDFFEFEHEYLFDEVITDMPQVTAAKPRQEIRRLYLDFFRKVPVHLKDGAILVLYSTEPQFAAEAAVSVEGYRVEKKFLINEKAGTSVLVISWKAEK